MSMKNFEIDGIPIANIIDTIGGSLYWKNKKGVYLGCNSFGAKLVNLHSSEDVIGKTDFDIFSKELADTYRRNDLEVMNQEKEISFEETCNIDGKNLILLSFKKPLYDKGGKIAGVVGNSVDITKLKKSEADLKLAKEKAELADKVKTDFLYNMRHDMRTSLGGIEGFSGLIRDEAHDKKIKEHADNLVASCRALTHLHNQILNAIQVFSGDVPMYKNKFDICGKLQQIINLNLAKAGEKGLKLSLTCDKAIPKYLVGDCKRLTGIALELISNALKYTHKGSVVVNATLEKKQDTKITIKFTVKDTGIGIPEDKKEEIFTRFGRLTPSYEGKYIGLGLGLSLVKQFIDDLGGEIYVSSEPKKGSTFTCYLPFVEALSADDTGTDESFLEDSLLSSSSYDIRAKLITTPTGTPKEKSKSNGCEILLVEDDPVSAKVAQLICNNMGQKIDVARNGTEALEKTKLKNYDLIFMDVGLPDMNGNEVTRKIRIAEREMGNHMPIVALTAHVDTESKQECIEAGMDAVLSKPISVDKINDMLDAFVPRHAKKTIKPAAKQKPKDQELLTVTGKVFDLDYLRKELQYDDKTINDLLKIAPKTFAEDSKLLRKAYAKKDWLAAREAAHKLNGSAGYSGTLRLKGICYRFEGYIKANKTELAAKFCELILKELEAAEIAIKKYLEKDNIK